MSTDTDRDPALAAVWREHSTEAPPPEVDAAILAAAHRAAASAPRGRGPRAWRWAVPLAAAAVIAVIVVGVKPPSQTMVDESVQSATDMPAAPAPKPQVAAPLRKESAAAPAEERAKNAEAPSVAGLAPAPEIAPATPDATAPRPTTKLEAERAHTFAAPLPDGAAALMAAPARPASPAARADQGTTLSADDWIARLRALRARGAQDEALRELARFRAVYPDADARLPTDLREWAKNVR